MEIVLEWAFRHPLLVLLLLVAAFVIWLTAPITWRDGEGSVVESGENVRDWYNLFAGASGNLWFIVLGRAGRR